MKLVYRSSKNCANKKAGDPVEVGDVVTNIHNSPADKKFVVTGYAKPRSAASTGRVRFKADDEQYEHDVFPSIVDAEWIEREDR